MLALGTDGGGICSAEELVNAIKAQEQKKAEQEAEKEEVRKLNRQNPNIVSKVPPAESKAPQTDNPVADAFNANMTEFMERFGIMDSKEALAKFNQFRSSLQLGGVIPDSPKMHTIADVSDTFDAIYKNFTPSGDMK